MGLIDKNNTLQSVRSVSHIELELGCGDRKRNKQAIGIDMLDSSDVDIVGDVYEILALFPSSTVDAVCSYHFVEHLPDLPKLLSELARIVKPGGLVEFVAPHFSNPYFYSDPTHRTFFGLYTFCYFADESPFARLVPTYGYKTDFKLAKVDLIFKSTRPFVIRHGIRKVFGLFFNSCNFMKELYEENFCYFVSCYEVKYVLRRHKHAT